MFKSNDDAQVPGKAESILVAKVNQRAIPALDRVAIANQTNTAQLMAQFFGDITDLVDFVSISQGGTATAIEDKLAELIVERCRGVTPQALQAMGHVWYKAAEKLATGKGG